MVDDRDADAYNLGYRRVDEDPNVAVLVATMEATSQWRATMELREWERRRLRLAAGERLLDVGCGLGEAARDLSDDLGPDGHIVGIDVSVAMLEVARASTHTFACPVRFSVGDALALDQPSGSFDVARSERTLQWLDDPGAAVFELVRVLRPGGRLSLIDTDWSTLRLDIGGSEIEAIVREGLRLERRRASNVGSRLIELARGRGLNDVVHTAATQVWTAWDPDRSPAPDGCFSMWSLAEDLSSAGLLDSGGVAEFVSTIHDAARQGRYSMALTMHAVVARRR